MEFRVEIVVRVFVAIPMVPMVEMEEMAVQVAGEEMVLTA